MTAKASAEFSTARYNPFDYGVVSVWRATRYTCARLRTVAAGVNSHH
jgi:hypothetical protein